MTSSNPANVVKLFNAALDDAVDSPAGVVLRGALDLATLQRLLHDDYQREAQPISSQGRILDALQNGSRLPDVDLGMRGDTFETRDGCFYLKDPTFIIDGVQRISTIIHYLSLQPQASVRIGATIHLNTTKEWERDRFRKLNSWRNKLSPNILLRNMQETNPAVQMLYNLSTADRVFPLHCRVSWSQKMTKDELISALTFAKVVLALHGHKVSAHRTHVEDIGEGLEKLVSAIGIQAVRENIRIFFELIDTCWGIKSVQYKQGAIYMRAQFLTVLARILSDHHDFWQDAAEKRLFVANPIKRKIAQFGIGDPEVVRLAGSAGSARQILYILMRDHINKGKTTKRLSPRPSASSAEQEDDDEESSLSA